jgi:hypothetical protein
MIMRLVKTTGIMLVRVPSIYLTLVGLLWAAVVTWFFLMTGGLEVLHFAYLGKAVLWYGWMFVGPLFLLVGPFLYARARYQMAASVLLGIGCLILSTEVGWILLSVIHDLADPLIMKPPYGLYASGLILTALADICTVLLIRRWRNS